MSKEQIEEMAKDLCQNTFCSLEEWNKCKLKVGEYCANCRCMAERLYNAGYRKQSEIVRCKDCEYAYMDGDRAYCRNIQTPWYNDYFEVFTEANDFCNYAKMKGGAE